MQIRPHSITTAGLLLVLSTIANQSHALGTAIPEYVHAEDWSGSTRTFYLDTRDPATVAQFVQQSMLPVKITDNVPYGSTSGIMTMFNPNGTTPGMRTIYFSDINSSMEIDYPDQFPYETYAISSVNSSYWSVQDGSGGYGWWGMFRVDYQNVSPTCTRWQNDRQSKSEGSWTGNASTCTPGDNITGRANALKMVNLYRSLAKLPELQTTDYDNAEAQSCALMMQANNSMNHNPPTTWKCYSSGGYDAASHANISGNRGVAAIDNYMIDAPANGPNMGHRRWLLGLNASSLGLGSANNYSCLVHRTAGSPVKTWVAWPPEGYVPYAVFSAGGNLDTAGWTIQSESINLNYASVQVTMNSNVARPVTVTTLTAGYGSNYAIRIVPYGWTTQAGNIYHVAVGNVSSPFSYDVQVVDCGY